MSLINRNLEDHGDAPFAYWTGWIVGMMTGCILERIRKSRPKTYLAADTTLCQTCKHPKGAHCADSCTIMDPVTGYCECQEFK